MARSFTITQEGESRSFTIETGVGPTGPSGVAGINGPAGPAPSGTGLVSVTAGVLDTPATLSARVASDAANLRNQLGLGTAATKDTSTGGNAAADAGKVVEFDSGGGVTVAVTGPQYAIHGSGGYAGVRGSGPVGVSGGGTTGAGGEFRTTSGLYHAIFGDTTSGSFVSRALGAFGWIRGIFTGRIQSAGTLTADRTWTLPDKDGTVAMTVDITGTNSGVNTGDNSPNTSSATAAQGTLATNSVQLTGNQTIAGDKAFASTTRPTSSGTGTPAAASLITAQDAINEMALSGYNSWEYFGASYGYANGGKFGAGSTFFRSGTQAGGWGRQKLNSHFTRDGSSGNSRALCSAPLAISYVGFFDITNVGTAASSPRIRFYMGGLETGTPPLADQPPLAGKGFGCEFYHNTVSGLKEVRLFSYDAGLTYSAGVPWAMTFGGTCHLVITSNGSGTIKLFSSVDASHSAALPKPSLILTHTGGPTSGVYVNTASVVECINHSTIAPPLADCLTGFLRGRITLNHTL